MNLTRLAALVVLACIASPLRAQPLPRELAELQFEQKLGDKIPTELRFTDDQGREVAIDEILVERPTILMLGYQRCPRLCAVLLKNLVGSLAKVPFNVGADVNVVHVSIDPKEDPSLGPSVKSACIEEYGRPGSEAGWHFLRSEEATVRTLAKAVGFAYEWDASKNEYSHPSGVVVLAPDGTVARYLFGLDFSPRDLRLAIAEASQGKVAAPTEKALLLTCMSYDPVRGKYGFAVMKIMRLSALLTVALVGVYLVSVWRSQGPASGQREPAGSANLQVSSSPAKGEETSLDAKSPCAIPHRIENLTLCKRDRPSPIGRGEGVREATSCSSRLNPACNDAVPMGEGAALTPGPSPEGRGVLTPASWITLRNRAR